MLSIMRYGALMAGLVLCAGRPALAGTYTDVNCIHAEALVRHLPPGTIVVQHYRGFANGMFRVYVVYDAEVAPGIMGWPDHYSQNHSVKVTRELLFQGYAGQGPITVDQQACGGPYPDAFSDENTRPWEYLDLPYTYRSAVTISEKMPTSAADFVWVAAGTKLKGAPSEPLQIGSKDIARIADCARSKVVMSRLSAGRDAGAFSAKAKSSCGSVLFQKGRWFPEDLAANLEGKFVFINRPLSYGNPLTGGSTQSNGIYHVHEATSHSQGSRAGILLSADGLFANVEDPGKSALSPASCGKDLPGTAMSIFVTDDGSMEVIDEGGRMLRYAAERLHVGSVLNVRDRRTLTACKQQIDQLERDYPLDRIELGKEGEPPTLILTRNTSKEYTVQLELGEDEWMPDRIAIEPRSGSPADYVVEWQAVEVIQCSAEGPHREFWGWETHGSPWRAYERKGTVFLRSKSSPTSSATYGFTPGWRERFRSYLEQDPTATMFRIEECNPAIGAFRYRIRKGEITLKVITVYPVMGC